jgi:hypothetical protein
MSTQAEIDRVTGIKNRWHSIIDIRGVIALASLDSTIPNDAKELIRIINEDDTTQLEYFESLAVTVDADRVIMKAQESKQKDGAKKRELCYGILDLISEYNGENSLTEAQLDSMEVSFAQILVALQNVRPVKAKNLITALTPDGILVTQNMKDDILSIFTRYGI